MPNVTNFLARSLIEAHGEDAVTFAELALHNVQRLNIPARVQEWEHVIAAIKAIQEAATEAAPDNPSSGAR